RFINQGYPKNKIIMSYATTTSKGYNDANGNSQTNAAPIGVRNGLLDGSYTPDQDVVIDNQGYYRFLTGVNQTLARTEYVQEKDLAGIMYWDMGNDVPTSHPYSLPKISNFAIASNVDTLITEVDLTPNYILHVAADSPRSISVYPNPSSSEIRITLPQDETSSSVFFYNTSGQLIQKKYLRNYTEKIEISSIPTGLYNVFITAPSGNYYSSKFVKQ
ncbi:MAG: T9SS type A sorting domain-containing protein, partial [Pigmentiphaga sp.]|nr:T9SS type A sorting domain-containing protein [Pigmentiphaga sp.]